MTTHGPERHLVRCSNSVDFRGIADIAPPSPIRSFQTPTGYSRAAHQQFRIAFFNQVSIEIIV